MDNALIRQQQRMLARENNKLRDYTAAQGIFLQVDPLEMFYDRYTVRPAKAVTWNEGVQQYYVCQPHEATAWGIHVKTKENDWIPIALCEDRNVAEIFCATCQNRLDALLDPHAEVMTQEVEITFTLKFEVDCKLDRSDIEQEAMLGITDVLGLMNSDVIEPIDDHVPTILIREEAEIYHGDIADQQSESEQEKRQTRRR